MHNLLLIFIKNPEKGKVKTRLADSIGHQRALEVYQQLLQITKKVTLPLKCARQVWYSTYIEEDDLWSNAGYQKRLQTGKDLGQRMQNAFKKAFTEGYEKVLIIGSDCAELTTDIIQQGFRVLDDHDVVVGPSKDGGYYLLGMTTFYPDLFSGINWSTPTVFEETVSRLKSEDRSFMLMPTLNDIDTKQDLTESEKLGQV